MIKQQLHTQLEYEYTSGKLEDVQLSKSCGILAPLAEDFGIYHFKSLPSENQYNK